MSRKENIFDLSKLVSDTNDKEISGETKKELLSPESREAKLKNYELVPPTEWLDLKYNTYIKYLNKDGTFPAGGFVQRVFKSNDKKGDPVIKIELVSGFGNNRPLRWIIMSSKFEKIWKKINQDIEIHMPQIQKIPDEIKEEIDFCKKSIKFLTIEIQNIKNQQIKILDTIRKLHKI